MNTDKQTVTGGGNAPRVTVTGQHMSVTLARDIASSFGEQDNGTVLTINDQRALGVLLDILGALPPRLRDLAALVKLAEGGRRIVLTSGIRKAVRDLVRASEAQALAAWEGAAQ